MNQLKNEGDNCEWPETNYIIIRSIFEKGGSVADAAIAALFCEGVSLPQSMGLGGGFLLTIYDKKTGTVRSLNAREVAPLAANETMFNGDSSLSQKGAPSISLPVILTISLIRINFRRIGCGSSGRIKRVLVLVPGVRITTLERLGMSFNYDIIQCFVR